MAVKKNNVNNDVNSDVKASCYDLVIVGAGLVGATLAASIAGHKSNQHIKIALVDQNDAPLVAPLSSEPPEFDPRVVALTQESIKLLKSVGAWSAVKAMRTCAYRFMRVWDNEGTGEIIFDAHELSQSQLGVIVENRLLLSAVLEVLANQVNVTLLRGQSISDLATEPSIKNNKPFKKITLSSGQILQAS